MTGLVEALADAVRRGRGPAEAGSPSYLAYLLREAGAEPETAPARHAAADLAEPLTGGRSRSCASSRPACGTRRSPTSSSSASPTVKRHIANAYGKLGVGHRTEAVVRANELNLL